VGIEELLGLPKRFELSHPSLAHSGRLMRLLCPIIRISISDTDSLRNNFSMGYWITSQLIRDDLPGFTAMVTQQPIKEALRSSTIAFGLKKYINNLPVLIHCSPQIVLLAVDFYKDFIDEECVTVAAVFLLQLSSV
jgi:hypothetical protein